MHHIIIVLIVICIDIALFIRVRGLSYKSLVLVFDLSQAENIFFRIFYISGTFVGSNKSRKTTTRKATRPKVGPMVHLDTLDAPWGLTCPRASPPLRLFISSSISRKIPRYNFPEIYRGDGGSQSLLRGKIEAIVNNNPSLA
jgi:hypothetical protein